MVAIIIIFHHYMNNNDGGQASRVPKCLCADPGSWRWVGSGFSTAKTILAQPAGITSLGKLAATN